MIERTLVLLKPDAVMRGFMGRILSRFEDVGLKIVGTKMMCIDKEFAQKHYFDVKDRHGQVVLDNLTTYLTQGPVLALCLEGVQAVAQVRKMVGATNPEEALPGTIRGDFSHITKGYATKNGKPISNLIHASSKPEEAEYELDLWFDKNELHSYSVVHEAHTQ